MGVDDEYRAVSANEDSSDALLEKSQPMSRAAYKKRSMAASILIGALIGAGVMFLFSALSATSAKEVAPASAPAATTTVTATATVLVPAHASTASASSDTASQSKTEKKPTTDAKEEEDDDVITDCGGSPEQARSKGCVFDVMMQLWMPAPCYDSNLSERYLLGGNWTWWGDGEAKKTLTLDQMRKGEHTVTYVAQSYHKQHCIFAWEKSVRALRNDQPLIEELISIDHMTHCRHRTLSEVDANVRGVRAPTGYTRCAKYDTWVKHMPANSISTVE